MNVVSVEEGCKVMRNVATMYLEQCTCWVRSASREVQYTVRWGAHNLECPLYRESMDPVDKANDEELRAKNA